MSKLDSKIPNGPLADKWTKHKNAINLVNPAVDTQVDLAPNAKREREINVALSNSFGFGGTNASVLFGRIA